MILCWRLSILLVGVLVACSATKLTLSEYAIEAEGLVATMEMRFDSLDAWWLAQEPTSAGTQQYWAERLSIRHDFRDGIAELNPPDEVENQHDQAMSLFARITAADEALAERATSSPVSGHWDWVDTVEGQQVDGLLAEIYAFCRASQEQFDATQQRAPLQGMPWIPTEMSEVVSVAFGCPPPLGGASSRGLGGGEAKGRSHIARRE